jgi:hypothetical protein
VEKIDLAFEKRDSSSAVYFRSNNKVCGWPPQNDRLLSLEWKKTDCAVGNGSCFVGCSKLNFRLAEKIIGADISAPTFIFFSKKI